jgi:hypothetical protein
MCYWQVRLVMITRWIGSFRWTGMHPEDASRPM